MAMGDRAASAQQAAKNFNLFGAPHALVLITDADLGVYGAIDCGLYLRMLLLTAHSLGLGTVAQAAIANHGEFVRDYLDLPDDRLVVCGVSLGWPALEHPANSFRTSRAALEETVTWVE